MRLRLPEIDTPAPTATWREGRYVDVPDSDGDALLAGGAVHVEYSADAPSAELEQASGEADQSAETKNKGKAKG